MSSQFKGTVELDYHKKELLISILYDCILQNKLPEPLGSNIKEIVCYWEQKRNIQKICDQHDDLKNYTPFGMEPDPGEISLNEKRQIQSEIEKVILETYPDSLEIFETITIGELREIVKQESSESSELTGGQRKIVELANRCHGHLQEMRMLCIDMCVTMKVWIDLRLNSATLNMERKAILCNQNSKINELKAKLISLQMKKFVYRGITTIRNYVEYHASMKAKLDDYRKDVEKFRDILLREGVDDKFFL